MKNATADEKKTEEKKARYDILGISVAAMVSIVTLVLNYIPGNVQINTVHEHPVVLEKINNIEKKTDYIITRLDRIMK